MRMKIFPLPMHAHGSEGGNVALADGHSEFIQRKDWNYRYKISEDHGSRQITPYYSGLAALWSLACSSAESDISTFHLSFSPSYPCGYGSAQKVCLKSSAANGPDAADPSGGQKRQIPNGQHARKGDGSVREIGPARYRLMRDHRLKMPLHYDFYRNGWHYTQQVSAFPSLQITEGEVVALVMAEKALKQYRGTTFEKPLLSAIQKMQDSLPDTISVSLADMDRSISFQTRVEPIVNMEIFDALARATATRRQIVIDYRKPAQASPEKRTIDPGPTSQTLTVNGIFSLMTTAGRIFARLCPQE